ncbi:hypothetical protein K353_06045 [Kitasatospora sp. SolWspMP-SS2h]|nr:hypothetical protein K353_06045 [Kitasatospora sp. SolWspMP-SS2h]
MHATSNFLADSPESAERTDRVLGDTRRNLNQGWIVA